MFMRADFVGRHYHCVSYLLVVVDTMNDDILLLMLRRVYFDLGQLHALRKLQRQPIPEVDKKPIIIDEYNKGWMDGLEMLIDRTRENHAEFLSSQLRTQDVQSSGLTTGNEVS